MERNIAETKCGGCGSHEFELVSKQIKHSEFLFWFVQCCSCGVAIAVMEHNHIGSKLDHIIQRLSDVEAVADSRPQLTKPKNKKK